MASILCSVCSINCSDTVRGFFSCFLSVGWSQSLPPTIDGIRSHQFHPNSKIRSHKLHQLGKELFSNMLSIESLCILFIHFKHLKISNNEIFFNLRNNFSNIHVAVRFDHSVSSSYNKVILIGNRLPCQIFLRELVTKIDYLKLPPVTRQNIPNIQIFHRNLGVLNFLQENFMIFHIMLVLISDVPFISGCWVGSKRSRIDG